MDSSSKPEFAVICRELRVNHRPYLKQREVAAGIGVATSTYGNIESSKWMVIGKAGAQRLARFYGLDRDQTERLMAAWGRLKLSPHGEKRKKQFDRRNAMRAKAKHFDRLMRSLVEVLSWALLGCTSSENVCKCSFDEEEPCEICMALENLGLDTFTTIERAQEQLGKLAQKLDAERAAAAQK